MSVVKKPMPERSVFPPAGIQTTQPPSTRNAPQARLKSAGALKFAEGHQVAPTTHHKVKRKKSMVTISLFAAPYRSLKRSDTVTGSKVRACIEMGSLLHSC
jgi:hypothetical protein